jgi:hypothetical protein
MSKMRKLRIVGLVTVLGCAIAAPVAQAPSTAWYFCRSENAYYPYVTTCPEGWQPVAPTP